MVELVDTQDLKSCGRKAVRVQVPLLVLVQMLVSKDAFFLFLRIINLEKQ
jgi:hypothetical protein